MARATASKPPSSRPCPKCQSANTELQYGGERGEGGPWLLCYDCEFDEEADAKFSAARFTEVGIIDPAAWTAARAEAAAAEWRPIRPGEPIAGWVEVRGSGNAPVLAHQAPTRAWHRGRWVEGWTWTSALGKLMFMPTEYRAAA